MRVRISYRDRTVQSTELDAERLLWDDRSLRVDRRDGQPFLVLTDTVHSVSLVDGDPADGGPAGTRETADATTAGGAPDLEGLAHLRDAIPQTR